MTKGIFITGASGFLGKGLVKRMIKEENLKFYVLTRSDRSEGVIRDEIVGADPERISFIKGDITFPYCGVDRVDMENLAKNVNEIWHLAASTSFDENKRREIELTNIKGTENILKLAGTMPNLDLFNYTSTAYVCGEEQGNIAEDRLELERKFKNPYEESKLYCEERVRNSQIPFAIIRPSILVGNSQTGEAKGEFRMIYGYLLGIYSAALHEFKGASQFWQNWHKNKKPEDFKQVIGRLKANGDVTKNLVTIDDVVNVSMGIMKDPDRKGRTYNIVNSQNVSVKQIVDAMQSALHIKGLEYVPDLDKKEVSSGSMLERLAYKLTIPYDPYVHISEPSWAQENVTQLGVRRVPMTQQLLDFLINRYVERYMVSDGN